MTSPDRVLLYRDDLFLHHQTGPHPESPARLRSILEELRTSGLLARVKTICPAPASIPIIQQVHGGEYISSVEAFATNGGGRIEADTVLSSESYSVALHAAGAAIDAVDQVLTTDARIACCLTRPPGHHALANAAMGFCLFNNIAVAARHAICQHGCERVLIVDWDVHHGNGTQAMFYDDPQVVFFSAHRSPFYPGTGTFDETGTGAGLGTIFNLPLTFGISRHGYLDAFEKYLHDAAGKAKPDLILISAGFDAHAADPVGSLGLMSEDFAELTDLVLQVAETHCEGRIVSILEGGYHLDHLAESYHCHLERMVEFTTK
ncbi:histone deacetylase family protein [Calycomorphotria hydatis]|uniref:Histone deacetylase-like amidohydrolase n=1 Tax=Calycomorphotria hydatis TaxID=2528027 RepID=A0A517T5K0_9PLAN|nr:histone deacetylase [Calycomorphotria hydatis]QDT63653.1 Histone deacetylase-like amidohydrolase [Calycomorphotria hydatis]